MFGVSRGDGGEAVARSDEPSKLPILQRGGRSTHDTNAVVREDTPGVTTIALARLPDGGGKLFGCNCTRTLSRLHGYARYSGDEHVVVVVAFETERALCKSAAHGPEAEPATLESAASTCVHISTDPQSDVARARSWAAICVQDFDAPCVLQFAWVNALCCALHRSTSQVIHRSGS